LEEFGKAFVPSRAIPYVRRYIQTAGINIVPYKFFGALFYLTAIITGILYISFIYPVLARYPQYIMLAGSMALWFVMQMALAAIIFMITYFYLDLRIYKRTKKIEDSLPEFLQIVSSNLKGGMSFENALFGAIKPRFDVLAKEMEEVSKKVMTGFDISLALREFSQKYNSPMLNRSIDLMISEVESGGHVTSLIDKIVDMLKETKILKQEISASVITYTIFISVIVMVISPLLFALSYHLLLMILNFVGKLSTAGAQADTFLFSVNTVTVNPVHFRYFSMFALGTIALFSSMIVSIVEKGNVKSGLKYIPLFISGTFIFYFIFMKVLAVIFRNLQV